MTFQSGLPRRPVSAEARGFVKAARFRTVPASSYRDVRHGGRRLAGASKRLPRII